MRLLWISSRWPFPPDDGAKQASASLVLALADLGHEIDILTFAREAELAPSPHVRVRLLAHYRASSLGIFPRALSALKNLGSSLPFSAAPFAEHALSWRKVRALLSWEPHAAVFDGPHAYAAFFGGDCPWPILYRAHNHETSLWEQAARQGIFRAYFAMQAARMREFEAALGKVSHGIAAISPVDTEVFRAWLPGTRVDWVPMGFDFAEPPPLPGGEVIFGYIGRMDWPPNRAGLRWFLEKVWPKVRMKRPGARLRVAGSGDGRWLKAYAGQGFEWLGRIESVPQFYAGVHAALVPVHFGSGTKIKLVESARYGRAAFATPAALSGSGLSGESLALLSDDPESWIEALAGANVPALAERGRAAFTEASRLFGARTAAERFLSLLPREAV